MPRKAEDRFFTLLSVLLLESDGTAIEELRENDD